MALIRQFGGDFYRSARSTLAGRCKKKLMEKTSWYKRRRKSEPEEKDQVRRVRERSDRVKNGRIEKKEIRKGQQETAARGAACMRYGVSHVWRRRRRNWRSHWKTRR